MDGAFTVPQVLCDHYGAYRFSPECVSALRDVVDTHDSLFPCDPTDVKKVVKVGSRIAQYSPHLLSTDHYERLHEYAHEAIVFLNLFDAKPHLQAHFYGDAADITKVIFRRLKHDAAAQETGADYLRAVKRSPHGDIAYRLGFLCKLGEFGLEVLVEHSDDRIATTASRELDRFPIARVGRYASLQRRARHVRSRLHFALPR